MVRDPIMRRAGTSKSWRRENRCRRAESNHAQKWPWGLATSGWWPLTPGITTRMCPLKSNVCYKTVTYLYHIIAWLREGDVGRSEWSAWPLERGRSKRRSLPGSSVYSKREDTVTGRHDVLIDQSCGARWREGINRGIWGRVVLPLLLGDTLF